MNLEILVLILCITIVLISVVLAVVIYHQLLLYNEVNKRLIALTSEMVTDSKLTQDRVDEINAEIQSLQEHRESSAMPVETAFNPHTYYEDQNEETEV